MPNIIGGGITRYVSQFWNYMGTNANAAGLQFTSG